MVFRCRADGSLTADSSRTQRPRFLLTPGDENGDSAPPVDGLTTVDALGHTSLRHEVCAGNWRLAVRRDRPVPGMARALTKAAGRTPASYGGGSWGSSRCSPVVPLSH